MSSAFSKFLANKWQEINWALEFLQQFYSKIHTLMEVKILVNGKELKLKDYPRRVLHNLLLGYVKSLNLEEEPQEIQVHLRVEKDMENKTCGN